MIPGPLIPGPLIQEGGPSKPRLKKRVDDGAIGDTSALALRGHAFEDLLQSPEVGDLPPDFREVIEVEAALLEGMSVETTTVTAL